MFERFATRQSRLHSVRTTFRIDDLICPEKWFEKGICPLRIFSLRRGRLATDLSPDLRKGNGPVQGIKRTSKIQLNGVGIVHIAPGCYLRTSGLSLPSLGSRALVPVVTYEPCLHLKLSELSPVLLQNKQFLTLTATSKKRPEDTPAEESRFEDTDETLNKLEDQLNEVNSQEQSRSKQTILTHGSYVGIGLLSIGLITYFGRARLMTAVTNWRPCLQRKGQPEDQPAIRLAKEPSGNQAADSHSDEFRIERRCTTTTNTPAPKNRTAQISTST